MAIGTKISKKKIEKLEDFFIKIIILGERKKLLGKFKKFLKSGNFDETLQNFLRSFV